MPAAAFKGFMHTLERDERLIKPYTTLYARLWFVLGVVGLALLAAFAASSEASRRPGDALGFVLLPLAAWGMYLSLLGELRGSKKYKVVGQVLMFSGLPIVVYIYLRWLGLLQ